MYGEHIIAASITGHLQVLGAPRWLAAHAVASTAAVGALTYLHVVIGEVVPKSLGLQHAERLALAITPIMMGVRVVAFPLVSGLSLLATGLLRLAGVSRQPSADRFYTSEELELIVHESQQSGALRADAGRMLKELFEFGDLTAGQVMVPRVRVQGLRVGATPDQVRTLLRTAPHTRYPVYEHDLDHLVGMIHIKDLLRRITTSEPVRASDARPLPVVPETAPLDGVLAAMRREPTQMAVVIDEHGGTAGIVTLEDLFEEVVGEIDEGPSARPPIYTDADGRLHVAGTVRLDEVGQRFNLDLTHEDVDSVSGLVLTLLGRPPKVGDAVEYLSLRFEVTAVHGRGVRDSVVIRR
jgi:CBS domain containing-hemolysin-like protein